MRHWNEAVRTWGTTAEERRRRCPCDDALPDHNEAYYRAVTVESPAAVGVPRGGSAMLGSMPAAAERPAVVFFESDEHVDMHRYILAVLVGILWSGSVQAEMLSRAGSFDNVTSRDGGEHCSGYSITLWTHKKAIFGLFDVHSGLCGDPPCVLIRDVKHSSDSGRFSFSAHLQGTRYDFEGFLLSDTLRGTLNGEALRLPRRDSMTARQDISIEEWCGAWRSVTRCSGVKEFCQDVTAEKRTNGSS